MDDEAKSDEVMNHAVETMRKNLFGKTGKKFARRFEEDGGKGMTRDQGGGW